MAAKTFVQLSNDALLQADEVAGSGSATAKTIIKSGINESYAEIAGIRDWKTLENNGTITTVSGTMEYTPITSSASIPRIRRIHSVLDETNNHYLNEVQREDFEQDYPFVSPTSSNNQGSPITWFQSSYTSNRDINIKVYPVPNAAITLRVFWYEEPIELVLDTDIPRIPDQFHYGLTYLGLAKYAEFQHNFQSNYYRSLHEQYKEKILNIEWGPEDLMPTIKPMGHQAGLIRGKLGRIYN